MSFHCFLVFIDILVKNDMKFDLGDQPRWHFNLEISLGIVYINKKEYLSCPTIGDKQNKLWHIFVKEHFVVIKNHTVKAYLMAEGNAHNLSLGEKITKQCIQCGSDFIMQ